MADMNQLLAEFYKTQDTTKVASSQPAEQEKLASAAAVQLFCKVAAANGYDVAALAQAGRRDVVDTLWNEFQGLLQQEKAAAAQKTAEFPPPKGGDEKGGGGDEKDDDKKRKMEEAKKEHEEKKAEAQKLAFADFEGRVMAHSMVQELGLIQSGSPEVNKTAAAVAAEYLKTAGAAPGQSKEAGHMLPQNAGGGSRIADLARKAAPWAAGAAAAGGAGAAAHHLTKKEDGEKSASMIDQLAVDLAVNKIAQAYGVEEAKRAIEKIAAADTLELFSNGSTKVAAAPDTETAIDWRACEMLELVGYKVNWPG